MRPRSRSALIALAIAAVAFAPAAFAPARAADEKKPAPAPLEVTYYYLPG